jgi:amino acid adenylation domain-containing protein
MNPINLSEFIYGKMKVYPAQVGLEVKGQTFSYCQIIKYSLMVTSLLKELGARKQSIGIVSQRSAGSYFAILGVIFSDCYYVPINPKYSADKKSEILKDACIEYLIGEEKDLDEFRQIIDPFDLSGVKKWIVPFGDSESISNICVRSGQLAYEAPLDLANILSAQDLAYLMYTSGSTGKPKGVMVTRSNLVSWLVSMSDYYMFDPGYRASQTYDLSFDLSVADIFLTWCSHGTICVLDESEHLMPSAYITREEITHWSSVPTLINFMNKMGILQPNIFPLIQESFFCGEPLPERLADAWSLAAPNSRIVNFYGPTEATIWITQFCHTRKLEGRRYRNGNLPIGDIFPNHQIALIDEVGNKITDIGEGEIIYKGPQVTAGYLNDRSKTDLHFVKFRWDDSGDVWYKSGDLGVYGEHGALECLGRTDNQLKMSGRRVEIGEIESVLSQIETLSDIVIVPLKSKVNEIVGLVGFTANEILKSDIDEARIYTKNALESIFFPKMIFSIRVIPVTTSGKTDRKSLGELAKKLME